VTVERVKRVLVRVQTTASQQQAADLKALLAERYPEVDWTVIAAEDVVVMETEAVE
jgi:hypothetical protein